MPFDYNQLEQAELKLKQSHLFDLEEAFLFLREAIRIKRWQAQEENFSKDYALLLEQIDLFFRSLFRCSSETWSKPDAVARDYIDEEQGWQDIDWLQHKLKNNPEFKSEKLLVKYLNFLSAAVLNPNSFKQNEKAFLATSQQLISSEKRKLYAELAPLSLLISVFLIAALVAGFLVSPGLFTIAMAIGVGLVFYLCEETKPNSSFGNRMQDIEEIRKKDSGSKIAAEIKEYNSHKKKVAEKSVTWKFFEANKKHPLKDSILPKKDDKGGLITPIMKFAGF